MRKYELNHYELLFYLWSNMKNLTHNDGYIYPLNILSTFKSNLKLLIIIIIIIVELDLVFY